MSSVTISQLSYYQLICLKNMYDNEIWPQKICIIQETGEIIVEYLESEVNRGDIVEVMKSVKIPRNDH